VVSGRDEWINEPARPGWWSRLTARAETDAAGGERESRRRPRDGVAAMAYVLAGLGALALVVSLSADWITVTANLQRSSNDNLQRIVSVSGMVMTATAAGPRAVLTGSNGVASVDTLGLVYGLTGVAMLVLTGAVLTRPELALRWRLAATGLGVGVLAVAVGATSRMASLMLQAGVSAFAGLDATDPTRSYEPGVLAAYAVALLPVAAIWVRSWPAGRAAAGVVDDWSDADPDDEDDAEDDDDGTDYPPGTVGTPTPALSADEPSFWSRNGATEADRRWRRDPSPPEPYDLSVTPED
jgi:hypothetical protein